MPFRRFIPLVAVFAILAGGSVAAIFPPALVSTGTQATLTRATAAPEPTPSILDVTNAQKLALTEISAGQEVRISDAFVVSGAGNALSNGFWYQDGTDVKGTYAIVGQDSNTYIHWVAPAWGIHDNDQGFVYTSEEDVDFPWQVVTWTSADSSYDPVPTLTHPAVQSFLGGDPSDEASWATVDDVPNAAARFAITGIPNGKRVHQVDNNTEYQYNGVDPSDAANWSVVP